MKKSILYILTLSILVFSFSCQQDSSSRLSVKTLPFTSREATSPYLTEDHRGNAVLCWTERSDSDSLYRLKYAVYDAETNQFGNAITVEPSKGTKPSPESMNKVAFKSDGTIIAVFTRKFENQENRFAGAILYTASTDHGSNWSTPRYLHSDTSHTYGRSYFDLARLKNGEIGSVWLDGRYGKAETGSALFFASTSKGNGFGNEKCIDRNTCECCRTDLLAGNDGKLHIAYRSIMFPAKLLGKQVRDMAYTSSDDNGQSFQATKTISEDHWAIEGCPHTGPSLAENGREVSALWFTAGQTPGVYFNRYEKSAKKFSPRQLQSASARHPQQISLKNGNLAMVWEEEAQSEAALPEKSNHHHGMVKGHSKAASSAKIILQILKGGKPQNKINLTDGAHADHHAVLTPINDGALVAWVTEVKGTSVIRYTFIDSGQ